jgi:hypothetical protein
MKPRRMLGRHFNPKWTDGLEYRIKPEPKPDIEKLMYFYADLYQPDTEVLRSHLGQKRM